jgi:small subunit ribosomal protein S7
MSRKGKIVRREIPPDPKFNSVLVTKFIGCLMRRGKRSTAERIIYGCMDILEKNTGSDGLSVMKQGLNNVKPVLEVKSRRVGGATYQVPVEVRPDRRTTLALRWLISYAASRPDHSMKERLAAELTAAYKNEGGAVKKKEDTHRMAEANKAFAHYRW